MLHHGRMAEEPRRCVICKRIIHKSRIATSPHVMTCSPEHGAMHRANNSREAQRRRRERIKAEAKAQAETVA